MNRSKRNSDGDSSPGRSTGSGECLDRRAAHSSKPITPTGPTRPTPPARASSAPAATGVRRSISTFTESHILAITEAICDYRREQESTGPFSSVKTRMPCPSPAQRTALEVLAAGGVETILQRDDGVTPTPVISHAILVYNRGRTEHHGRRHRHHAFAQSPRGRRLQIQPAPWRPGRFRRHLAGSRTAPTRCFGRATRHQARPVRRERSGPSTTLEVDFVSPYVADLANVIDMEAIRARRSEAGRRPARRRGRPLLAADRRSSTAWTSPSPIRRSIPRSAS